MTTVSLHSSSGVYSSVGFLVPSSPSLLVGIMHYLTHWSAHPYFNLVLLDLVILSLGRPSVVVALTEYVILILSYTSWPPAIFYCRNRY